MKKKRGKLNILVVKKAGKKYANECLTHWFDERYGWNNTRRWRCGRHTARMDNDFLSHFFAMDTVEKQPHAVKFSPIRGFLVRKVLGNLKRNVLWKHLFDTRLRGGKALARLEVTFPIINVLGMNGYVFRFRSPSRTIHLDDFISKTWTFERERGREKNWESRQRLKMKRYASCYDRMGRVLSRLTSWWRGFFRGAGPSMLRSRSSWPSLKKNEESLFRGLKSQKYEEKKNMWLESIWQNMKNVHWKWFSTVKRELRWTIKWHDLLYLFQDDSEVMDKLHHRQKKVFLTIYWRKTSQSLKKCTSEN